MNKVELVAAVAQKSGLSKKDAEKAVSAVLDSVVESVASGDKVQLVGFGTFEVRSPAKNRPQSPYKRDDCYSSFETACLQGWQGFQRRRCKIT